MKTQQQAQEIFNVLVTNLEYANDWNLCYVTKNLNNLRTDLTTIDTPLEHFLKSARKKLDVSEDFLSRVYAEAFHTGPIPKNRNHIGMTCDLKVNSGPTSPVLSFWVDLDKVADQLNTYLRINPPYRFEVKYHATNVYSGDGNTSNTSSAVNSLQNPLYINFNFLLGCIVSGVVSVSALLIAALAVASIITLSTAGIFTAVGVGLVAGVASYCFFKARSGVNTGVHTTIAPTEEIEESSPENIEDIFRNHFAATIGTTILSQDPVVTIGDEQALTI